MIPNADEFFAELDREGEDSVRKKRASNAVYGAFKRELVDEWLRRKDQTRENAFKREQADAARSAAKAAWEAVEAARAAADAARAQAREAARANTNARIAQAIAVIAIIVSVIGFFVTR